MLMLPGMRRTIFIISGLGIIYADPDLLTTGIVDKGDALVVSAENLKSFIEKQDDFWIKVQIPYKPNACHFISYCKF
jgi:hypothetical protein